MRRRRGRRRRGLTGRLRTFKEKEAALPGMEMWNFLELYFLEYFLELCTRLWHGTLHVRGGPFLKLDHPEDLDGVAWECGQRGCTTPAMQGSCPAKT